MSTVRHICITTTRESQISLSFALRSLIFQIIEVLVSPWGTMVNSKFSKKKNAKNLKLKILKIPNIVLPGPMGAKISMFQTFCLQCVAGVVLNFWLLLGPMLTKTNLKKTLKFQFSKFQKSQTWFCEDHWEEN